MDLATPNVVMEADPLPPFTYWAPESATIRNHPRMDGVWIAPMDRADTISAISAGRQNSSVSSVGRSIHFPKSR